MMNFAATNASTSLAIAQLPTNILRTPRQLAEYATIARSAQPTTLCMFGNMLAASRESALILGLSSTSIQGPALKTTDKGLLTKFSDRVRFEIYTKIRGRYEALQTFQLRMLCNSVLAENPITVQVSDPEQVARIPELLRGTLLKQTMRSMAFWASASTLGLLADAVSLGTPHGLEMATSQYVLKDELAFISKACRALSRKDFWSDRSINAVVNDRLEHAQRILENAGTPAAIRFLDDVDSEPGNDLYLPDLVAIVELLKCKDQQKSLMLAVKKTLKRTDNRQ